MKPLVYTTTNYIIIAFNTSDHDDADRDISDNFRRKLEDSSISMVATIKHDGTCSYIQINDDGLLQIYKRYDIRPGKGRTIPEDAIMGAINENGVADICWINITKSLSPGDAHFLGAYKRDEDLNITELSMVNMISPDEFSLEWVPISDIKPGTYELIGPKVQGNIYKLPTEDIIEHTLMKKKKMRLSEIPRHYFVEHGIFPVTDTEFTIETFELETVRDYIVERRIEGLVFHCSDGSLFKVNRGHIGVEIDHGSGLRLTQ
eukprot:TRINITY_DN5791_c0_g1_i2.p1 TRINITY_DN5791_c0_g1~~TRINITY_DN5791_c0_g1_i2.p1  ORF type:complete len:261 (-),score=69.13 TRINITY_DN5791_c0_g1_i2:70-852(-)